MNNSDLALIASSILSILLSFIQITTDSKIYDLKSILTFTFLLYVLLMIVGNILTTLISVSIIDTYNSSNPDPSSNDNSVLILKGPIWIWYAAFGVFGFEALIQKVNITFFDKGVLSINDWITKAKNSAVEASLDKFADLEIENVQKLAYQLSEILDESAVQTLALKQLGKNKYGEAINSTVNNPNIDQAQYLAHILANEAPRVVKAEIKANRSPS